ncbi:hypothetical protein B0T11DRAFT_296072 [Plectosphaerella cucumerina]|uniref:Infection structure specific protein n=1 Tax=Plectosphaerella cucumerina TaxID=40658 RepID=A0A8K0TL78_9PEZI|nr:hypothetical protein B0T11DRAFT_296072 [Plectosphaerella cucumerina]
MRTSLILLPMAASASVSAALLERLAAPAPTPAPALAARATDDTCSSAIETILPRLTNAPLPDPTLISFIAGQDWETMTDFCSPPEVTGDPSMVAGWSSYMSEVYSFYSEHTSDISALAAACTADSSVAEQFPFVPTQCDGTSGGGSETGGQGGSSGGSGSGGGSGSNGGGSDAKDKDNQGASVRGEAMFGAAVAMAGMVVVGVYY